MQVKPLPYTVKPVAFAIMIRFGVATGHLSLNRFDGYAPDPGLNMTLECSALAQHMIIIGATGVGKTVLIRQLVQDIVRFGGIGILIMDGKGSLASEFIGLAGYTYIDPRHCTVGLLEGLDPQGVTRALAEINVRADAKDPIWQELTRALISTAAEILWHLVKLDALDANLEPKPAAQRVWRWSFADLDRVAVMIQSQTPDDKAETTNYMDFLRLHRPTEMKGLLGNAVAFVEHEIPAMAESVRGSVLGNYKSWTAPVMSHPDILRWCQAETGVDPEACLNGGVVGINLGEVMFGRAGVIASSFIKNRIYAKGKQRADYGNDWRTMIPGATPTWFVMDEYPAIATDAEVEIALQGRSLGLWLCVATQNIEAIYATNPNKNRVDAFLGNLLNRVVLQTTPQSVQWLQSVTGPVWIPGFMQNTQGIDYVGSARNALGSPLYDTTHPDRPFMKSLLRRGFGAFHKIHFKQTVSQWVTSDDHAEQSSRHNVILGGGWKEEPLLSIADFMAKTQKITTRTEGGVAFVSVMRAGAIRRDFVQLDPPRPIADDLMDPAFIEAREQGKLSALHQIRAEAEAFARLSDEFKSIHQRAQVDANEVQA